MERSQKTAAVAELQSELTKSKNAILFGFAGLKVPEVTELRRQVRGTRSRYLVVKNTLALRAARGTAMEASRSTSRDRPRSPSTRPIRSVSPRC